MKALRDAAVLFALAFLFGMVLAKVANAQECSTASQTETETISAETPKALQGAIIVVMTTDGNRYQMNSEEYKVVPRKQQRLVSTREVVTCNAKALARKLNRVTVLGGVGPTGELRTKRTGSDAEVEARRSLVLGVGYSRQLNDTVSAGIQVQDGSNLPGNTTVLFPLSFDY